MLLIGCCHPVSIHGWAILTLNLCDLLLMNVKPTRASDIGRDERRNILLHVDWLLVVIVNVIVRELLLH